MADAVHTGEIHWGARASAVALLAALAIAALSIWGAQAAPPKPRSADPGEFSAERAHNHLKKMCVETHPTGSQAALRVRQYIEQTVREMGYEPEVQKALLPRRTTRVPFEVAYIENVVVRIPGTASTGAFLNMAHYDSVPYGLGAADDGAGCAALLETLRALKHHPPLKNDLIFLFTDGEEAGLLGPKAFLGHEYINDVKAVLNYESRGYYGPSMMFELSEENGWLIDQVAQAAPHPAASSVMFDAAGRMPTTTDYEVLKKAGFPGMGLAFVGGIEYYHTYNDSPENISLGSLQHHGEYGLPLNLHFGNVDLSEVRAPNKVYFDLFGRYLVRYPQSWLPVLVALGLITIAGAIFVGLRRGAITFRAALAGMMVHIAALAAVAVPVGLIMLAGFLLNGEYVIYRTYTYLFGFAALTLCIYLLVLRAASKRLSPSALAAGALLLWAPVLVLVSLFFPGGSYIPLWPSMGASLALMVIWRWGHLLRPLAVPAITLAGALPALLIITPMLYLSVLAMTIVPAPFWMMNVVLLCTLLTPLLVAVSRSGGLVLPAGFAGIAVPLLLLATFGIRFTETTPKMVHLCYGMDCNSGDAYWISKEKELDGWLANFFQSVEEKGSVEDFVPGEEGQFLRAKAPAADLPAPKVEVTAQRVVDGVRELVLRVSSPRKAARLDVAFAPDVEVLSASVNGVELGDNDLARKKNKRPWRLQYQGLSYDGFDLTVRLPLEADPRVVVREQTFGVPPIPGLNVPSYPKDRVTVNNVKGFWLPNRERFQANSLYTYKDFDLAPELGDNAELAKAQ